MRRKDLPNKFKIKPDVAAPVQSEMELKESIVHYVATPKDLDEYVLDSHNHLIVKHDLFNHDGKTQEGIAEAFLEFAKKENLSFVGKL